MSSPVQLVYIISPVSAPQIFTHGTTSDPRLTLHDLSAESGTPKVYPTPRNNPTNLIPNVPDDSDSDPSSSHSSSSDSSDSSDDKYYKRRRHEKRKKNAGVKRVVMTLSKSAQIL